MRLERDDVVVVTGGASGIGLAVARRFAAEGARIVVVDVNEAAAVAAAGELEAGGASAMAAAVDVVNPAEMEELRDRVLSAFGSVAVVMNNAGIGACGRVWELSAEIWRASVDVNVLGVVNGMRAFVPALVEQGRGHVVNTASMAGLVARPYWSPYVATKFAVAGLTEAAFHELAEVAPNIGVSLLCPGPVSTDFLSPSTVLDSAGDRIDDVVAHRATTAHRMTVQQGIAPSDVAAAVFDAVSDNRFYVLTHPAMAAQTARRAEDIVAGRPPTLQ